MDKNFLEAVEKRRSYYSISKDFVISDEEIRKIIEHAVLHTPSAFNSQSTRIVLLLGSEHDKLWNMTKHILRAIVPGDQFAQTEEKINSFRNGYGTILYYEDTNVVNGLMESYPLYADNFPIWSHQTAGMHQFVIWTALENEGFGVSLQHYNELISDTVAKEWNIPSHWSLNAQMPFGKPTLPPGEKTYLPLEDRIKIY